MISNETLTTGAQSIEKMNGVQSPIIQSTGNSFETNSEAMSKLLASIEKPGEDGNSSFVLNSRSSQGMSSSTQSVFADHTVLPTSEKMVRKIKQSLNKELNLLQKQARKLSANAVSKAYELNSVVANIRKLQEIIAYLAHATLEYIENLYRRLYQPLSV